MKTDGKFKWYFGAGSQPEHCDGPFDTKAECLNEALATHGDEETFTIMQADKLLPSLSHVFRFDAIMERLEESNEDIWGEDGMPDVVANDEQKKVLLSSLESVLDAWFRRCKNRPTAYQFGTIRHQETYNEESE